MLIHGNDGNIDSPESRMPHKVPKRILHFSDGTLEEFSTDDESIDGDEVQQTQVSVEPSTLPWGPWIYYQTATAGCKALAACDYMGEALANFFGILQSKYQYEIDEFNRIQAEEKEIQQQHDLEMGGWSETVQTSNTTNQQPAKIIV